MRRPRREGRSLTDLIRALVVFYNRVEMAAVDPQEGEAISRLREKALTEEFIQGVVRPYVRRELRRLQIDYPGSSLFEFRDLALKLFQDMDAPTQESYESPNTSLTINKVATKSSPHIDLLQALVEGQAQINKTLQSMMLKQEQRDTLLHELTRSVNNLSSEKLKQRQHSNPPQCSYC